MSVSENRTVVALKAEIDDRLSKFEEHGLLRDIFTRYEVECELLLRFVQNNHFVVNDVLDASGLSELLGLGQRLGRELMACTIRATVIHQSQRPDAQNDLDVLTAGVDLVAEEASMCWQSL